MNKELLFSVKRQDLDIQTFKAGGKGGQHQNKTDSGVRIIHRVSGAVGESRSDRSQYRNKHLALQRLVATRRFQLWVQRTTHELTSGKTIEQRVNETMAPGNIRIEVKSEKGKWKKQQNGS